jgi:hypothetical protein
MGEGLLLDECCFVFDVGVLLASFEEGDEVEPVVVHHFVDEVFGVFVVGSLMADGAGPGGIVGLVFVLLLYPLLLHYILTIYYLTRLVGFGRESASLRHRQAPGHIGVYYEGGRGKDGKWKEFMVDDGY